MIVLNEIVIDTSTVGEISTKYVRSILANNEQTFPLQPSMHEFVLLSSFVSSTIFGEALLLIFCSELIILQPFVRRSYVLFLLGY